MRSAQLKGSPYVLVMLFLQEFVVHHTPALCGKRLAGGLEHDVLPKITDLRQVKYLSHLEWLWSQATHVLVPLIACLTLGKLFNLPAFVSFNVTALGCCLGNVAEICYTNQMTSQKHHLTVLETSHPNGVPAELLPSEGSFSRICSMPLSSIHRWHLPSKPHVTFFLHAFIFK